MTMTGPIDRRPIIPLGGGVMLAPPTARAFGLGRPESIAAAKAVTLGEHLVFASLRDPEGSMSEATAVYHVGVTAVLVEYEVISQHVVRIFVEAVQRVSLDNFVLDREGFYRVSTQPIDDLPATNDEVQALYAQALEGFAAFCARIGLPSVTGKLVAAGAPAGQILGVRSLPWVALSYLGKDSQIHWVPIEQRQALLEAPSLPQRLRLLIELLDTAKPPASLASDMTPFIMRAANAARLS